MNPARTSFESSILLTSQKTPVFLILTEAPREERLAHPPLIAANLDICYQNRRTSYEVGYPGDRNHPLIGERAVVTGTNKIELQQGMVKKGITGKIGKLKLTVSP